MNFLGIVLFLLMKVGMFEFVDYFGVINFNGDFIICEVMFVDNFKEFFGVWIKVCFFIFCLVCKYVGGWIFVCWEI